ncbi:MAG: glutathione transferase GstA [Desulforhopalus sp.]
MKLYYSKGACSLAPHIIFRETGLPFTLERVNLGTHQLADGGDYYAISPRGQVPLLELDNGQHITEGPVICQYIAEHAKREDLLPPVGDIARYRVLEWQNFTTSELHKSYSPLFNSEYPKEARTIILQTLRKKYEWVDQQLSSRSFVTGDTFTVADAYVFTVTQWADYVKLAISDLENLMAFQQRVADRETVREALKAEE